MIVCTEEQGGMGKIIISRRTERATETEFPGSIMATQVVSAEDAAVSISLAKLGKDETASCSVKKHLTQSNSQEANCVTSVSQTKATKDITRKGDCSPAHSKKLTRELEGPSPHRFVYRMMSFLYLFSVSLQNIILYVL